MEALVYTGVGSREAPPEVLAYMTRVAAKLALRGYLLRSGAAQGSDAAFEAGCKLGAGQADIWMPWPGFNGHVASASIRELYATLGHREVAATIHPAWKALSRGPAALHARNVGQVLGEDLCSPSDFLVCWTRDGAQTSAETSRSTGGTGTAIRLASLSGVPVVNLARPGAVQRLNELVLSLQPRPAWPHAWDGSRPIFVFGSNLAGRHGKGAALCARYGRGAEPGVGAGRTGDAYAIPTKDADLKPLPAQAVDTHIRGFIQYAHDHPRLAFDITKVGCGLAGGDEDRISALFAHAPENCRLARDWETVRTQQALRSRMIERSPQ